MSFRQLLLFISPADFSEREASLLTSCKEENARNMETNVGKAITLQKGRLSTQSRRTGGNTGRRERELSGHTPQKVRVFTEGKDGEKAPLPCFQRDGEIYCNQREATYRANEEDVTHGCCGRSAENSRQAGCYATEVAD